MANYIMIVRHMENYFVKATLGCGKPQSGDSGRERRFAYERSEGALRGKIIALGFMW